MKIEPMGSRALIRPAKEAEKSAGGVILPQSTMKDAPERGEVIAAGPESKLGVGDQVIFKKYAPDAVKLDGEELLIVEETDVIGRLV